MQKCPYCHGDQIANMAYNGNNAVVGFTRYEKTATRKVATLVCLDCGGVFVGKKDCESIKKAMEGAAHDE